MLSCCYILDLPEMDRRKVFVVLLNRSSFAIKDLNILKQHFDTKSYVFKSKSGFSFLFELLTAFLITLKLRLQGYRTIYSVFADYQMFLPVLFSKLLGLNVIISVGGNEVNVVPEIAYGARLRWSRRMVVDTVLKRANYILPKSESLTKKVIAIRGRSEGVVTVHNGFDLSKFKYVDLQYKDRSSCLSIASVSNVKTFYLKGFNFLIEYAKAHPEIEFTVVGISSEMRYLFPKLDNLKVLGFVAHNQIEELYEKAEYFLLTSLSEGMPNVLCEAIFSGCVPISTDVGNAAYVIGNDRLIMERNSIREFDRCLSFAGALLEADRKEISTRARGLFSIETREEALRQICIGI